MFHEELATFHFPSRTYDEYMERFGDRPRVAGVRYGAARSYWPEKYPILGCDVSHWNDKIDWDKAGAWRNADGNGLSFVICKSSDGTSEDDRFHRNFALCSGSRAHQNAAVAATLVAHL